MPKSPARIRSRASPRAPIVADVSLIACGAALVLAIAVSGCTWVGPEVMRSGRPAYNAAIRATNDQQLLQNIVRTRFADSVGFLNVSSITANVSVTTSGTANVGFGPSSNYAGNLVPFGAA